MCMSVAFMCVPLPSVQIVVFATCSIGKYTCTVICASRTVFFDTRSNVFLSVVGVLTSQQQLEVLAYIAWHSISTACQTAMPRTRKS